MKKNTEFNLLKELIPLIEEFQVQSSSTNLNDFVIWTNHKLFDHRNNTKNTGHDTLLIAFRIMHLNKELKKQTKAILSQSNVSSIDEYSFLLHLNYQNSFRKMELIELHNLEAPTGIEIIKRLLRNKLIEEFADEDDRRAKRIHITKNGTKELQLLEPQITEIFATFTNDLELDEKIQIAGILDKLIK